MTECYFIPKKESTSATICANCGKEKIIHTIGEGIKITKTVTQTEVHKYKVGEPRKLSSWKEIAKAEIKRWLTDKSYEKEVTKNTMKNEYMGPFTKFLYHFAYLCECGWGVMIDFSERGQKVFLPDHYYRWMHKLRDEVITELEVGSNDR